MTHHIFSDIYLILFSTQFLIHSRITQHASAHTPLIRSYLGTYSGTATLSYPNHLTTPSITFPPGKGGGKPDQLLSRKQQSTEWVGGLFRSETVTSLAWLHVLAGLNTTGDHVGLRQCPLPHRKPEVGGKNTIEPPNSQKFMLWGLTDPFLCHKSDFVCTAKLV